MAIRRVKFTFPTELIKEPIIYNLGHRFEHGTHDRHGVFLLPRARHFGDQHVLQ